MQLHASGHDINSLITHAAIIFIQNFVVANDFGITVARSENLIKKIMTRHISHAFVVQIRTSVKQSIVSAFANTRTVQAANRFAAATVCATVTLRLDEEDGSVSNRVPSVIVEPAVRNNKSASWE